MKSNLKYLAYFILIIIAQEVWGIKGFLGAASLMVIVDRIGK